MPAPPPISAIVGTGNTIAPLGSDGADGMKVLSESEILSYANVYTKAYIDATFYRSSNPAGYLNSVTNITGNAGTVTTISGRISAGTNISISGAGTAASPYVISATGGGITSINGNSTAAQLLTVGSSGTDFAIDSTTTPGTSVFKLPDASATARGLVTTGTQTFIGTKTFSQAVSTSGSPNLLVAIGASHTTLTASTEATDVSFNLARTVQFAAGALTTQRAFRIQAPTYAFASASTITTASTLSISGPPVAGTNATITNPYALNVESGNSNFNGNIYTSGQILGTQSVFDGGLQCNFGGYGMVGFKNYVGGTTWPAAAGGGSGGASLPGFQAASNACYAFSSTVNAVNGTTDVNISRNAAGIVQIGTTSINALGSLLLKNLTASGLISPQQAASAPTYVKGAIYFDTTMNKLRIGGATAWETVTSV